MRTHRSRYPQRAALVLVTLLTAACIPHRAAAQQPGVGIGDSVSAEQLRARDCRRAVREAERWMGRGDSASPTGVVQRNHAPPYDAAVLGQLSTCGASAGPLAAEVIASLRTSTDSARVIDAFGSVRLLRDSALFARLYTIAGDPGASTIARAAALADLHVLLTGTWWWAWDEYAPSGQVLRGVPYGSCGRTRHYAGGGGDAFQSGTPLPAGYKDQIRALARQLARDASQPERVRAAASCSM